MTAGSGRMVDDPCATTQTFAQEVLLKYRPAYTYYHVLAGVFEIYSFC